MKKIILVLFLFLSCYLIYNLTEDKNLSYLVIGDTIADNPYIGTDPRYMILRRQGYKVLITEKNLVFYKIDEKEKVVTVYAVVDRRQDYLNIIRGL